MRRLFIFFGGVDKDNMTLKCLHAISSQLPLLERVHVIVGRVLAPHKRDGYKIFVKNYEKLFLCMNKYRIWPS